MPDFRNFKATTYILASVMLEMSPSGSGGHSDAKLMSGSVDIEGAFDVRGESS